MPALLTSALIGAIDWADDQSLLVSCADLRSAVIAPKQLVPRVVWSWLRHSEGAEPWRITCHPSCTS